MKKTMTDRQDREAANKLIEKLLNERRAENAKAAQSCTKEEAAKYASFLHGWAKKKPITKWDRSGASNFWACGKNMSKIEPELVNGLVKFGHVTLSEDGFTMTMIPVGGAR